MDINKKTRKEKRNIALNQTADAEGIRENFQILEEKLDYAQKQLFAWDFYKISQTISNDDEFQLKLNMLLPNTSAIISKKISNASPGDIFFKDSSYNIQYIEAERGGIYYPKKIAQVPNTNTYQIFYQFLGKEPTIGTQSRVGLGLDADPAWTINFVGLTASSTQVRYGETVTRVEGTNTFSFTTEWKQEITPVFKGYTSNMEEVYWDFTWTLTEDNLFEILDVPSIIYYIVLK